MIEFKFLNLQYIYCTLYSLLGGKCAEVEPINTDGLTGSVSDVSAGISTTNASVSSGRLDFWDGLFSVDRNAVQSAADAASQPSVLDGAVNVFAGFFSAVWGVYSAFAYTISGLLILLIAGAVIGLFLIRSSEAEKYSTLPPSQSGTAGTMRSRWQLLLDHAVSLDPKEWRTGILEADIMLGELLEKLGYAGQGTAERLQSVPEGAFVTLGNAWEAHRIRNFVQVSSSDYILTQREAFRVMKLYEQVFEEFNFV